MDNPLSPHLQIYRWQITSVLSILHRVSGVVTSIGSGASIFVSDFNTPADSLYVVYEVNDCADTAMVNVTVNQNPTINIIQQAWHRPAAW